MKTNEDLKKRYEDLFNEYIGYRFGNRSTFNDLWNQISNELVNSSTPIEGFVKMWDYMSKL